MKFSEFIAAVRSGELRIAGGAHSEGILIEGSTKLSPSDYVSITAEGFNLEVFSPDEDFKKALEQVSKALKSSNSKDAWPVRKFINWHGCDVTIENPVGSTRSGMAGLKMWSVVMSNDYGYLQRTRGADSQQLDCFVGNDPKAQMVYVITTMRAPEFIEPDEAKCMLDFTSAAAAKAAFFANYDRPEHFGSMEQMLVLDFIERYVPSKDRDRRNIPSVA